MVNEMLDVLVVDNDIRAAEDYARLIEADTGLRVDHSDDPDYVLEVLRSQAIKVIVLDQRMPRMSGTNLYSRIKSADARVRAIMLTGEATRDEVGAAMDLGFKAYLPKNKIRVLAQRVLHEYASYLANVATEALATSQPVILHRRVPIFSRPRVQYRLLAVELIDDTYVFQRDWKDLVTVHAGQTERRQVSVDIERSLVIEAESTTKLTSLLGLNEKQVALLKTHLQSELTSRFRETHSSRVLRQQTTEQTFQLPPEPTDPDVIHIRIRRVQRAPVYFRVRVDVVTDCTCCYMPNVLSLEVFLPTGRWALRHEDVLSSGEVRSYFLGAERP
jgi:CheY-like chemotaxis protein